MRQRPIAPQRPVAPLAWHARRQLGLFTRPQALAAGYRSSTIDRRLATGRWRVWHPGTYSDAGLPETWQVALMAALLAVGDDAVVAGLSAACLWKLPDLDREGPVQVLVPRPDLPDLDGVDVLGTAALDEQDVTRFGAFRITTVTRTLRELTRFLDRHRLLECAAEGWRRRLTTPDAIADEITSRPRWPGNGDLRWVQGRLDPQYARCRSLPEIRSHRAMTSAGIDGYVINARRTLSSGRRVEP